MFSPQFNAASTIPASTVMIRNVVKLLSRCGEAMALMEEFHELLALVLG